MYLASTNGVKRNVPKENPATIESEIWALAITNCHLFFLNMTWLFYGPVFAYCQKPKKEQSAEIIQADFQSSREHTW
jgi:hypothetical protein